MGYEIRLHIAQEYTLGDPKIDAEFGRYSEQLAMVDLSKPGYDSHIYKLVKEQQEKYAEVIKNGGIRYYLPGGPVEEKIFEDSYGAPLAPIPFREVYQALLKDYAESFTPGGYTDGYRRFALAVTVFEAVLNRFPDQVTENYVRPLIVLPYGY